MQADEAGTTHLDAPDTATDGKPYTAAGFPFGAGSVLVEQATEEPDIPAGGAAGDAGDAMSVNPGSRPDLTDEQATDIDDLRQAPVRPVSETHPGKDAFANGPFADISAGTTERSFIFPTMVPA